MSPEGRVRYTYTENASKNRSGGVAQLDVSHKVVHQFTHPELGERCHVFILDKYLAKIPDSVKVNYVRPLNKAPESDNAPWFSSVAVGKNQLSKMVNKISQALPRISMSCRFKGHTLELLYAHEYTQGERAWERGYKLPASAYFFL